MTHEYTPTLRKHEVQVMNARLYTPSELGKRSCMLAATISTEMRIPFFHHASTSRRALELEYAALFADVSAQEVAEMCQPTEERSGAVAAYRRTTHTVRTTSPETYTDALEEITSMITALDVLATTYTHSYVDERNRSAVYSRDLVPQLVSLDAFQFFDCNQGLIYNLPRFELYRALGSVGIFGHDKIPQPTYGTLPLDLFGRPPRDTIEYAPIFRRSAITHYGQPRFE